MLPSTVLIHVTLGIKTQYCNEIVSLSFISFLQQNVIYRNNWLITVCVLVLFWLSNNEMEEEEGPIEQANVAEASEESLREHSLA